MCFVVFFLAVEHLFIIKLLRVRRFYFLIRIAPIHFENIQKKHLPPPPHPPPLRHTHTHTPQTLNILTHRLNNIESTTMLKHFNIITWVSNGISVIYRRALQSVKFNRCVGWCGTSLSAHTPKMVLMTQRTHTLMIRLILKIKILTLVLLNKLRCHTHF